MSRYKTALDTMEQDVLPLWAERCSETCISKWNATIGELLDISVNASAS